MERRNFIKNAATAGTLLFGGAIAQKHMEMNDKVYELGKKI